MLTLSLKLQKYRRLVTLLRYTLFFSFHHFNFICICTKSKIHDYVTHYFFLFITLISFVFVQRVKYTNTSLNESAPLNRLNSATFIESLTSIDHIALNVVSFDKKTMCNSLVDFPRIQGHEFLPPVSPPRERRRRRRYQSQTGYKGRGTRVVDNFPRMVSSHVYTSAIIIQSRNRTGAISVPSYTRFDTPATFIEIVIYGENTSA